MRNSIVSICRYCGSENMEENRILGYMFCEDCLMQGEKISIDSALKDQYDKNSTQYTITSKKDNQAILGRKSASTEQKEFRNLQGDYYRYFHEVPEEIRNEAYSLYLTYKNNVTKNRGNVRLRIIAGFIFIVGEKEYPFCETELTKMIETATGTKKDYKIKDGINKVITYCNESKNGYSINPDKTKFINKYRQRLGSAGFKMPDEYVEIIKEKILSIDFKQDNDFVKHHLSSITAAIILDTFEIMAKTNPSVLVPQKKSIAATLGITVQKISAATNLLREKNILVDDE